MFRALLSGKDYRPALRRGLIKHKKGNYMENAAALRAKINRAEDRITRVTTTEDYLIELAIIQDAMCKLNRLEGRKNT